MRLSHSLTQKVIKALRRDPEIRMIAEIVRKNAYGHIYLVGGKLYRTLTQELHGYKVNAHKVDWDFFIDGEIKEAFVPMPWEVVPCEYTSKKNSMRLNRIRRFGNRVMYRRPLKIDMIGGKDIPAPHNIKAYFKVVPLDVQQIALDLKAKEIFGPGIESVKRRIVKVNNPKGSLPYALDINNYLGLKARSLKFKYSESDKLGYKIPCNCFAGDSKGIYDYGCQFPKSHC